MKDRSRKLAVINTGRKPQIETGGTTTTVVHAGIGGGGGGSMNLSDYLLKQIWDKAFEIRVTESGEEYLFGKLNFATQYGITMYANGGLLDLPSIYDGLPLDNDTIYWEVTKDEEGNVVSKVLKSKGTTDEDSSADFSNVMEGGDGNAYTSFTLSDDKKILTFVKGETFAKQVDFAALNTKVTDFLEGSDTDSIINKWKELEAFLSGMKESDDLATVLATKWTKDEAKIANWDAAFKWGDHSKVGYAKATDVTEELKKYVTLSGTQTITGEKDFTGGLKVNGSPIVYNATGKYWKFEGDLLVTGGITMFGSDSSFSPSTITQAVNIDGSTLVRKNGVIMLNPDIQIGGGSDIDLSEYAKKATTLVGYGITDAYTKTEADNKYLLKTSYTASDVLAKLKTVDGANSGLDADKLDGQEGSYYASTASLSNYLPLSGGSMTGSIQLPNGTSEASSIRWELGARINSDLSGNLFMISPSSIAMCAGYTGAGSSIHFQIASTGATGIAKSLLVGHDGYLTNDLYSLVVYGDSWYEKSLIVGENVRPRVTNTTNVGSTDYRLANVFTTKANVDGIEIKKSADGVLYIGGNLVVSGGITMYGTDGTTANTIWDNAPIANTNGKKGVASYDPSFFAVNNGVVTFIGEVGGGGIDSITKQMVLDALGYTPYNSTNPSGYITRITKSMVTTALGYTPYSSANPNGYITSSGSITGNAATATALKNAKTIWGNSFDGSANVSGNIDLMTSKIFWHGDENNYCISCPTTASGAELKYKAYSSHRFFSGGAERFTILSSGYIGIGTTNPQSKLQVDQSGWANGITINRTVSGGGSAIAVRSNGTHVGNFGISGSKQFEFSVMSGTSEQVKMTVDSSGNGLFYGGVTMYSDLRKKTILNHVELSLKEVADAPLIEHYYNSDESKRTHVGSIAQYWAGLNDWFCKEDEEGFLTMEIQNAALASAISVARELTRYESKTDKQIKKLKKRIGELEEEIENLKKV